MLIHETTAGYELLDSIKFCGLETEFRRENI